MTFMHPRKTHLFTPGPTPVPDAVLRELSAPIIHHRTPQWQESFGEVLEGLKRVFGTEHDVATFGASGSGAMESAVANLVRPGDEVVVATHGRFGMRWAQMAERYGATVRINETERGRRPDPHEVGSFVARHPDAKVVFCTHSETSTGAVSDAQAVASSIKAQAGDDAMLVLDAISSLGAAPVKADEWGWDCVVAGSQKALMVPPGLAFASISPRALEHARETSDGRWYFDWAKTVDAHRKSPASTPVTPALTIVLGLKVALELIFDEGLDNVYARHVRLGRATRAAVHALGFELFSPDDDSSVALTAVKVPEGVDGTKIPSKLKEYGVTIAGGQDDLKGQIFRLGHCGWVNELDVVLMIAALERGLTELGMDIEPGAGVAAAQRSFLAQGVEVPA
ncbi:MAG: alanine--glyoxylate aminotransferase family protein [Thermoleophilia bacterium]|nr:alanine--glyoxylate aminotransferase family protein [Thermoleophilia bacterium]